MERSGRREGELSAINNALTAVGKTVKGKLDMVLKLESVLKDIIKDPGVAPKGSIQLFDILKSYKDTPVLPTPTFLRLKAGLIESAPTQLARMGDVLEREQLVSEMDSLLAAKSELTSMGEGAAKGDFVKNPTGFHILGQILAGLTPAGMAADGRDVMANTGNVVESKGRENKLMLAMALVGFVPLVGDGAKAIVKGRLAGQAVEDLDEAAQLVQRALESAPAVFKDGDEFLLAVKEARIELPDMKAVVKGGLVMLEMSDDVAAGIAKNPGKMHELVRFAESKGVGQLSLSVSGPNAKEVLGNLNGFNAVGAKSLGRMRVEAGEELAWALRDRDKAKATYFKAQKESNRLITNAETALKSSDREVVLAQGKRGELAALTERWKSKGVSDSEYEQGVEQLMGESGFVRQGDTFVERGKQSSVAGSPSGLPESRGSLGRDGGLHPENDGYTPEGHRVSGQGDRPSGQKPGDIESDLQRNERNGERGRFENSEINDQGTNTLFIARKGDGNQILSKSQRIDNKIPSVGSGEPSISGRRNEPFYRSGGVAEDIRSERLQQRASRLESQTSRLLGSKVQSASTKNGLLRQELSDLRGGKASVLSGEDVARRRAGEARKRAMARYEDLKFVESRAKVVEQLEQAGVVRVSVEVDWTKGELPEGMAGLRKETEAGGIPHKWMGGLDPYGAHPGISQPPMGVVRSATAEAGELPGEITVYSARTDLKTAQNYKNVDTTRVANGARGNRFWEALYTAEDPVTAAAEVMGKAGSPTPEAMNVYRLSLDKARVLDLTDPKVAKAFGYEGLAQVGEKAKAYPISQSVAQKARTMGYDVIKVPSVKNGKTNWNVIGNFDTLVKKTTKVDSIIDLKSTTHSKFINVIAEANQLTVAKIPTPAVTTKSIVMALGGGLLLGSVSREARAAMGDTPSTPVERSGKTVATLGLNNVVNRLRQTDLTQATEKTLAVGTDILSAGKTMAASIWNWSAGIAEGAGTILQAQGENFQTTEKAPTLNHAANPVQIDNTPLPTLNVMNLKGNTPAPMGESFNDLVNTVVMTIGPVPTTTNQLITASWNALPMPMKPQVVQLASAMGLNAYGEGRDYSVVGGTDFGDRFSSLVEAGHNPETGGALFKVKPGETFNDGQKEWQAGSLFEKTEKGISLVRGFATGASIEGLNWGGKALTVIYKKSENGPQVIGVDLSGLKAGTKVEVTGTIHLPINKLSMLSGSFTMGDGGRLNL
ncbi:MAG: RES family NAD+ phosphorylase [Elusimicrobia bacterium]|nr:RES family NAD+ phosphorylase [Elusimicrobiota bacterium]